MERGNGFRVGESLKKPYGGNVADTPFSKTLSNLVISRGIKTETDLSRKSCKRLHESSISGWYTGKSLPGPENFGIVLEILKPDDNELESIISPWAEDLSRKARKNIQPFRPLLKPSTTEFGKWLESISEYRNVSVAHLLRKLGFSGMTVSRDQIGLSSFCSILETAKEKLDLTVNEFEIMREAIGITIENRIEDGNLFSGEIINTGYLNRLKSEVKCEVKSGSDVARKVHVSRQAVHQRRKRRSLPLLMNSEQEKILMAPVIRKRKSTKGKIDFSTIPE